MNFSNFLRSNKNILILLVLVFISGLFLIYSLIDFGKFKTPQILAGAEPNVWGWAWSENIGWISFNCTNRGTCGTVNYGVHICTDDRDTLCSHLPTPRRGRLTDYAWSRGTTHDVGGIGWIRFDPLPDFTTYPDCGYPASPCTSAIVDLSNPSLPVSGWARAYRAIEPEGQTLGGWDGWIKLRGENYGVWLDTSATPTEFRGWAWGGDDSTSTAVVGWISFNCKEGGYDGTGAPYNICGTSNYKVVTTFSPVQPINRPPYIQSSSATTTAAWCNTPSPKLGLIGLRWIYQDEDGDPQSHYHLQVATDPGFNDTVINCQVPQSVDAGREGSSALKVVPSPAANVCNDGELLGNRSLEISYRGPDCPYYWRVRVRAATGTQDWSTWENGPSFRTPSHAYPWVEFRWTPPMPTVEETVIIENQSECYTSTHATTTCSYSWSASDDAIFVDGTTSTSTNPRLKFSTTGPKLVTLKATDPYPGYSCSKDHTITIGLPLPRWREIKPF